MEAVNPFKDLRNQAGLSQYEVAKRANVSKHAVLRLEQGMYPDPLPTLVSYFVHNFDISKVALLQQYEAFQVKTRADSGRLLGNIESLHAQGWTPAVGHPLVWLRTTRNLNPTELAKRLCISQTVVVYFEQRSISQRSVPEQLRGALKDAGYRDHELDALAAAYRSYREAQIAKQHASTAPSSVGTVHVA